MIVYLSIDRTLRFFYLSIRIWLGSHEAAGSHEATMWSMFTAQLILLLALESLSFELESSNCYGRTCLCRLITTFWIKVIHY